MSVLESAMVWAPVETMTQVSRNAQKVIAKDVASLVAQVKALSSSLPKDGGDTAIVTPDSLAAKAKLQMAKTLQGMMKETQTLKRKLEDSEKQAVKHARLCSHRLHYLRQADRLAQECKSDTQDYGGLDDEISLATSTLMASHTPAAVRNSQEMDDADYEPVSTQPTAATKVSPAEADLAVTPQTRLDRMFADHLLRTNRPRTAGLLLTGTPSLVSLVDTDIFVASRRIEASLLVTRDCTRALAWCGENRSRLNKIASRLEFDLRLQEFLTLVQTKQVMQAIEYARKFLAPAAITPAVATPVVSTSTVPPVRAPPHDSSGLLAARNNSFGPLASDEKHNEPSAAVAVAATATVAAVGATIMVADPARVQILQEAMNLLVFDGFDQDPTERAAASKGHTTSTVASPIVSPAASPVLWHKYRVYWSADRFSELSRQFRSTHLELQGLTERSALEAAIHIGLAAIKTHTCRCTLSRGETNHETKTAPIDEDETMGQDDDRKQHFNSASPVASSSSAATITPLLPPPPPPAPAGVAVPTSSHHPPRPHPHPHPLASSSASAAASSSCPSCASPLSLLSRSLPLSRRTHSRLVCRISGDVLDEKNPPMALPNGQVYGRNALARMATHGGGRVTCPRTGQVFTATQARIAFVL